jgi:hypothetical protein
MRTEAACCDSLFLHGSKDPPFVQRPCARFKGAAIDVNRDGKLDIVCGGFWYEAPAWKKHVLREVPVIRGRYDDYSNLPMDVNGDGCSGLYWFENLLKGRP